jgi:DNA-binding beta-propeller fold protein YncE
MKSHFTCLLLLISCCLCLLANAQSVHTFTTNGTIGSDGVAVTRDGVIFTSDSASGAVYRIDEGEKTMLFQSAAVQPRGLDLDTFGRLYIADGLGQQILRLTTEGNLESFASGLPDPQGIAIDRNTGNLFVANATTNEVWFVSAAGSSAPLASAQGLNQPVAVVFDSVQQVLYVGNGGDGTIYRVEMNGDIQPLASIPTNNSSGGVEGLELVGENLYASAGNENRVYRVSLRSREVEVFAGSGLAGTRDGLLGEAEFHYPGDIARSSDGTMLIVCNRGSDSLREITGFFNPYVVTVDSIPLSRSIRFDGFIFGEDGMLYAAEGWQGNQLFQIRPDGFVTAISTNFRSAIIPAVDSEGNFFAANLLSNTVTKLFPDGTYEQFGTSAPGPAGCVVDENDNVYIGHFGSNGVPNGNAIYRYEPDRTRSVFASGGLISAPVGMAFDEQGNLYSGNILGGEIVRIDPDGNVSLLAEIPGPDGAYKIGHLAYESGFLFATGYGHPSVVGSNQVFKVNTRDGTVEVLAGNGSSGSLDGPADSAQFRRPNAVCVDQITGHVFVGEGSDYHSRIRVITREIPLNEGEVGDFIVNASGLPEGIAVDSNGNLYTSTHSGTSDVNASGSGIWKTNKFGSRFLFAEGIERPRGITVDADDGVVVAQTGNGSIIRIDQEGNREILVSGLNAPTGVAISPEGEIWVAETGVDLDGGRILKLSADGEIESFDTAQSGLTAPRGLCFDSEGSLYISSANHGEIYKTTQDGELERLVSIESSDGVGYLTWGGDRIYAAGMNTPYVYEILPESQTYSVLAGNGIAGFENGPMENANFFEPIGVAFDETSRLLYVSERSGGVRKIRL